MTGTGTKQHHVMHGDVVFLKSMKFSYFTLLKFLTQNIKVVACGVDRNVAPTSSTCCKEQAIHGIPT